MIAWFDEPSAAIVAASGGKGACLSRMAACGLPVPPGFVVCAEAFQKFLDGSNSGGRLSAAVQCLDADNQAALSETAAMIRDWIFSSPLPAALCEAIHAAYGRLGEHAAVAIRSSAICEDGEAASFAGQQETFLNVRQAQNVIERVRECWASFFTPRALFYRMQKGNPADTGMAVVVQRMIAAEKSGVMFTVDPVRKAPGDIVVEAVFGLGEGIVSGLITPDHYVVRREDGSTRREFIARQLTAIVNDENGGTREIDLPEEQGAARVLTPQELTCLVSLGIRLEQFFGAPQDVEWCIRGSEMFLLQSRPITNL